MKAITVSQPFAALIAAGIKTIETRTWKTDYRGPLLIHAGLKEHQLLVSYDFRSNMLELDNFSAPRNFKITIESIGMKGRIICIVDLVDIVNFEPDMEKLACCDHHDSYAWIFKNPRRILPFPMAGKQGIFDVNDTLIKEPMP